MTKLFQQWKCDGVDFKDSNYYRKVENERKKMSTTTHTHTHSPSAIIIKIWTQSFFLFCFVYTYTHTNTTKPKSNKSNWSISIEREISLLIFSCPFRTKLLIFFLVPTKKTVLYLWYYDSHNFIVWNYTKKSKSIFVLQCCNFCMCVCVFVAKYLGRKKGRVSVMNIKELNVGHHFW